MKKKDFTYDVLKNTLLNAKQRFKFIGFDENIDESGCVIMRHDIDMSIEKAIKMAELEHEVGVKATYFFLLRSDNYNLFNKEVISDIRYIHRLGHDIGLHFDHLFYGEFDSEMLIINKLEYERDILASQLGLEINSFAYHNTNKEILSFNREIMGGMLNAYCDKYFKKIKYCSDSYGIWRFNSMYEELNENKSIQILLHPAMWSADLLPPAERVKLAFFTRSEYSYRNYLDFIKQNYPSIINLK